MDWYTLSVVALVLAAFGAKLGRSFRSGPRLRTLERFARQAGLARAPEIERALIRRTTARERGYTIGIMAAVAGIGLWSITGATAASSGFLLAAIAMIGAVVGRGVAEWRSAFTPVPDQPRIARATTPGLADYVSPLERLATPAVMPLLSTIVLAFTIVTNLRQHTTRYLRRLWPDLAAEHAQALTRGAAV
jgi:hypothetical protein